MAITRYDGHTHVLDHMTKICNLCGITAEEIAAGRDRPATWEDVDETWIRAYKVGHDFAFDVFKKTRRRKLIAVGYYLCTRNLRPDSFAQTKRG